jgi:hypothetical protein
VLDSEGLEGSGRKYWAVEEPEELIDHLEDRVKKYFKQLRNGVFWRRVLRNLAYYHGIYYDGSTDSIDLELKPLGKQGEFVGIAANHLRNLLQHLLTLTTRDALAITTRATNSDNKSLKQTKLGRSIADYYLREKDGDTILRSAVENSLCWAFAFVESCWDEQGGRFIPATDEMGQPVQGQGRYEGDIEVRMLTPDNVITDLSNPLFNHASWVITRHSVLRWDLVARHPEYEDEIISYVEPEDTKCAVYKGMVELADDDRIYLYRFYHRKCEAVPTGRYCEFIPGTYFKNTTLNHPTIPVRRVSPGEWLGTSLGFTPGFDLQGLQEMFNASLSSFASAVAAFGTQWAWGPPGSEKLRNILLQGGLRMLISDSEPKPLNLLRVPPELMKFLDILNANMERISGINSVVRGDPEPSLKSGEALKVIEAKAIQFASGLQFSYYSLVEDVCTDWIRLIRDNARTPRQIMVLGKAGEAELQDFTADELAEIDRVVVDVANPLSKTIAGKDSMIKDLMAMGEIRTKEQYLQFRQTGNVDVLFEADNAQLSIVREENEALREGQEVPPPSGNDNHVMHIKEHNGCMGSLAVRANPAIRNAVEAHIMQHVQLLMDPNVQLVQQVFGYSIPPGMVLPPGVPAPPPPGNEPPGGGNEPPSGNEPQGKVMPMPQPQPAAGAG